MQPDRDSPPSTTSDKVGWAAAGIGVLAVACCAGLPLLVGLAGGLALGTVLGVGAGVLAVGVLMALALVRLRRRRACGLRIPATPKEEAHRD